MRTYLIAASFMLGLIAMASLVVAKIQTPQAWIISLTVVSILSIIICVIGGLITESITKYAAFSALIQLFYFYIAVNVGISKIFFINYIITGSLFTIILLVLSSNVKNNSIKAYRGLYDKNKALTLSLVIACLAFSSLPGFNIFVGQFAVYCELLTLNLSLGLAAITASLLCFLFYFRLCIITMLGEKELRIKTFALPIIIALSAATIILGLLPNVLFYITKMIP